MIVAAYARMSSDHQEESPHVQLDAIRSYCERNGHTIVAEYVDEGLSGGLELAKREAACRMLADAQRGLFQGIVCRSQRRLGRDSVDLGLFRREAKRRKLELFFVDGVYEDSAQGDFMWNVLAAQAEFERRLTGERIRASNLYKARQGRWVCGSAPLGFRYVAERKALEVDEARVADVHAVFEAFVSTGGNRTLTCRELNTRGIRGGLGALWSHKQLITIIRNPLYLGRVRYGAFESEFEAIPRIVPESLVLEARQLAESRGRRPRANGLFVWTPVLYCGTCGAKVSGTRHGRPPDDPHDYYACWRSTRQFSCKAPRIASVRIERLAVPVIRELLLPFASEVGSHRGKQRKRPDNEASRRQALESRKARLLDLYLAQGIDMEGYLSELGLIEAQLRELATEPVVPAFLVGLATKAIVDDLEVHWPRMTPSKQRSLILLVTPRIVLTTGRDATAEIHSPLSPEPIVTTDHRRNQYR